VSGEVERRVRSALGGLGARVSWSGIGASDRVSSAFGLDLSAREVKSDCWRSVVDVEHGGRVARI